MEEILELKNGGGRVVDRLRNIQPFMCSENFYKSIDKIFLIRKCQNMRKVFLLVIGMLSCGTFMHAGSGLLPLYDLYAVHQGRSRFWAEALEKTKDFVEEVLKESAGVVAGVGSKLESLDLSELAAFLRNRNCLECFLESDYFLKERYTPLLVNLLRLGYKAAASFDASIMETEGYVYVFSGDDIDILRLCSMGLNEEAGNIILRNKIDEED